MGIYERTSLRHRGDVMKSPRRPHGVNAILCLCEDEVIHKKGPAYVNILQLCRAGLEFTKPSDCILRELLRVYIFFCLYSAFLTQLFDFVGV